MFLFDRAHLQLILDFVDLHTRGIRLSWLICITQRLNWNLVSSQTFFNHIVLFCILIFTRKAFDILIISKFLRRRCVSHFVLLFYASIISTRLCSSHRLLSFIFSLTLFVYRILYIVSSIKFFVSTLPRSFIYLFMTFLTLMNFLKIWLNSRHKIFVRFRFLLFFTTLCLQFLGARFVLISSLLVALTGRYHTSSWCNFGWTFAWL